ncbi:MAG: phosphoribosylformylglycinamidine cyclo-ligase [Burkholderiales bacterium]|nr:phosphoribosylformylglycinamidine cyclo-ligase [Anaerolineae bacterium]
MQQDAYTRAGVNIASGNEITRRITQAVRATYGSEVLAGIGTFGGLFDAAALKNMNAPVLVASTDGVGTKTKVASRLNRWDTIGNDLVNHCVNDILVQGARPLFFLDYVASSKLEPDHIAALVISVADACREVGCALLGGETAEMPGVYEAGEVDLAGTIVGVVERERIIDGSQISIGDIILALPSSGLHTNGYSLARRVLSELDWNEPNAELDMSIGTALLAAHRCYLNPVDQLQAAGVEIKGLAHITGGGVVDNLPRILPDDTSAVIERGTWPEPPIFGLIQRLGSIPDDEMFHVFNMGLGMMVIVAPEQRELALETLAGDVYEVGKIAAGNRDVLIQGATS